MNTDIEKLMQTEHTYPEIEDPAFQKKIYEKVEFISSLAPSRDHIKTYEDVKEHRENICARKIELYPHQIFLSNFMNPDTPYRGLLVFHGTGVGKTCGAISIAEKFKPLVQKYGTKIYILVPGPVLKEVWRNGILKCTGETYTGPQDKSIIMDDIRQMRNKKLALNLAAQYYRILSYRSFSKKVLGDKIIDKSIGSDKKIKTQYRKTEEGDYARERSIDRIDSLNNTIIIVDEAHNLTNNAYGQALMKIIKDSMNLRVVLLTATPMKNLASDIIELLNFIRPPDAPILREKIFTSQTGHEMELRDGGLEYFKNMCKGYISYVRGADPLIFAKRVEMGEVPKELLFTKMISVPMLEFQKQVYEATRHIEDVLDRRSEAVANIVFPGLSEDTNEIIGLYGREGLLTLRKQIQSRYDVLNKKTGEMLKKLSEKSGEKINIPDQLISISDNDKTISGNFLKQPYLKWFSSKFDTALNNINNMIYGKLGPQTGFVYSNLVKVGIEMFEEVLIQNGWLRYNEQSSYSINPSTVCYYCGLPYNLHTKIREEEHKISNKKGGRRGISLNVHEEKHRVTGHDIPDHEYRPATFVTVIGKSSDETEEVVPEERQQVLSSVFSNIENREGKYIKLVLGSRVMNEGVSLENVEKVHILDVHYNLGRVDQVIGRAIRNCSHYKIINDKHRYPEVNVFKYAITMKDGTLSSEEELYRKAELKHLLIKLIERAMKETAIDCPLNRNNNIFKDDLEEYKNCKSAHTTSNNGDVNKADRKECPALCDYTNCNFICDDPILNAQYYDPHRNIYKLVPKDKLDYSTFTNDLARNEIEFAKSKIKDMFKIKYIYKLGDIVQYVKNSYDKHKKDLFDDFFVFKALDELVPLSENDFNNFKDTIVDIYNRQGYLIYRNDSYIYQPSNQNEDVPMYYRTAYSHDLLNKLSLYSYMKSLPSYLEYRGEKEKEIEKKVPEGIYDFESTREYYDSRDENKYVGIIDKEISRKEFKRPEDVHDIFKFRTNRNKILVKKRGTGIPSLKGAVCTTYNKHKLIRIAKSIDIKSLPPSISKKELCDVIQDKLLYLEKYSLGDKKITHMMIPANHPKYSFPYNLDDRKNFIIKQIKSVIKFDIDINVNKIKLTTETFKFVITIQNNSNLNSFAHILKNIGMELQNNVWTITIS
jgi:superfamily II DNA or RNA helicase